MKVDGRDTRAVWWDTREGGRVAMLDQRALPHAVRIVYATDVAEVVTHIRDMTVRGAPTIGAAAAYGMVLGAEDPAGARAALAASRPTARDLFAALEWMGDEPTLGRAEAYVEGVVDRCRRIGVHGLELLTRHARDGSARVLTHCNAGALAAVDHGTALAPIHHLAALSDRPVEAFVWVDETRPRLQGGLTAWELRGAGVPHRVIVDGAAASLMAAGAVDLVLVGADRVAANGDVANKIGTLGVAVAARHFGVPFYVAAPSTTFDVTIPDGASIPIEQREPGEVVAPLGRALHAAGTTAANPAFDVTPGGLISGYLTEIGVLSKDTIGRLQKAEESAVRSR